LREDIIVKLLQFLPQEGKFYDLLLQLAKQAQVSSQVLHQRFTEPCQSEGAIGTSLPSKEVTRLIHESRLQAKFALRNLVEEVCRTFITPFDREDLQELASALYAISSCLDGVQQRLHINNLQLMDGDFVRFSQLLVRQGELLVLLITGLSKGEKPSLLQEQIAALYELEDQGDLALLELESALYREETAISMKNLVLRKDIYGQLEDVTDNYRDAAAIVLRIILKHS
jgi:uncharacterized protein